MTLLTTRERADAKVDALWLDYKRAVDKMHEIERASTDSDLRFDHAQRAIRCWVRFRDAMVALDQPTPEDLIAERNGLAIEMMAVMSAWLLAGLLFGAAPGWLTAAAWAGALVWTASFTGRALRHWGRGFEL